MVSRVKPCRRYTVLVRKCVALIPCHFVSKRANGHIEDMKTCHFVSPPCHWYVMFRFPAYHHFQASGENVAIHAAPTWDWKSIIRSVWASNSGSEVSKETRSLSHLARMKGSGAGELAPQPAKGGMDDPTEKGKGKFFALKGKLQAKGKDIFALKGKFHATGKGGKDPSMAKSGGSTEPNSSKGKGQPVKAEPVPEKDSGLV